MTMSRRRQAFSLIELLIGLALISVLLGFYLGMNARNQVKTQLVLMQHRLTQILQYARNQALTRQTALVLHAAVSSKDWSKGVMIFKDNKNHQLTNEGDLIHEWRFRTPLKIKWCGFRSPYYLIFNQNLTMASANGHFSIFYQEREIGRVIINRLGRISLANYI